MKIIIISVLLSSFSHLLFAQTKNDSVQVQRYLRTSYNPKGNYQTWAIKGKLFPFIIAIGNGNLYHGLFGIEYGFLKNQSLGIDAYFLTMMNQDDDYTKGMMHQRNTAMFANYRYYLPLMKFREKYRIVFYTGFFGRIATDRYSAFGTEVGISDFNSTTRDSLVKSITRHKSVGFLLGTIFKISEKTNIDLNFGFYKKFSNINDMAYTNYIVGSRNSASSFATYNIRMGLNFYWYFLRNKK
jgi:hypothetical protein